jgi:hypothetical protein
MPPPTHAQSNILPCQSQTQGPSTNLLPNLFAARTRFAALYEPNCQLMAINRYTHPSRVIHCWAAIQHLAATSINLRPSQLHLVTWHGPPKRYITHLGPHETTIWPNGSIWTDLGLQDFHSTCRCIATKSSSILACLQARPVFGAWCTPHTAHVQAHMTLAQT